MNDQTALPLETGDSSDPYLNGQSEAEKLMRRHLQTPGDVITEEELKNLKITGAAPAGAESASVDALPESEDKEDQPAQTTPWDVIS